MFPGVCYPTFPFIGVDRLENYALYLIIDETDRNGH